MTDRTDYAREVRNALTDAAKLCRGLGITEGAKKQATGLLVRCPVHGERTPSCSVTIGRDGTVRVRCFACEFTGDALTLIAAVRGLNVRSSDHFREVLAEGAEIAGELALEAEIRDGQPRADRKRVEAPAPGPEISYPDTAELFDLWTRGTLPEDDRDASRYLVGRLLDPLVVGARQLARVLSPPIPTWACFAGRSWIETGHRLFVRAFDADAHLRGVRSIQVQSIDPPKRLPPKGKKAAELVLANRAAFEMLRGASPLRAVIVEGEPDWLTHAVIQPEEVAVLGIFSGSWTRRFAAALPRGCEVMIRTHADEAGERYAKQIADSIGEKCPTWRAA